MSVENPPASYEDPHWLESLLLIEQDKGFVAGIHAFAEKHVHEYDPKKVSLEYFEEYQDSFPIVKSTHLQRFAAEYAGNDPNHRAQISRFINGLFRAGYSPVIFGREVRPRAASTELTEYFRYRVDHYEEQYPVYEPVLKAERLQELSTKSELLLGFRNIGPAGVAFLQAFCFDFMAE